MNEAKQAGDGYDVVIVGGGIVGAATLFQLQQRYPDRTMLLIERKQGCGSPDGQQLRRRSISGLYYPPGSLKAKNCVEGRRALVRFAQEHNIPHDVCGKVVVAVEDSELLMLEKIHGIGQQNEIEGLERINADQLREIEPHCKGIDALWVPCTGIIDYRAATKRWWTWRWASNPSALRLGEEVTSFERDGDETVVRTNRSAEGYRAKHVVVCGGCKRTALAQGRRGPQGTRRWLPRRLLRIDRSGQAQGAQPYYPVPIRTSHSWACTSRA